MGCGADQPSNARHFAILVVKESLTNHIKQAFQSGRLNGGNQRAPVRHLQIGRSSKKKIEDGGYSNDNKMAPDNQTSPTSMISSASVRGACDIVVGETWEKCGSQQNASAPSAMGASRWHMRILALMKCCVQCGVCFWSMTSSIVF